MRLIWYEFSHHLTSPRRASWRIRPPQTQPTFLVSRYGLHFLLWGAARAVAKFFVTGGHYLECRRHEPCKGVWRYPPPENFQIGSLQNTIFSTCHERCLRKIDHKNNRVWKKTNPSTDLICLAQQVQMCVCVCVCVCVCGGGGRKLPPFLPAPTSYSSGGHRFPLVKWIFFASGFCNNRVLLKRAVSPQSNPQSGGPGDHS